MEKSLGKFSQYRKLHTDGAKNTDLEIRPAMGQRIVDDKAPDIGKFKEGVDEVKSKVSKPTGPNYQKDKKVIPMTKEDKEVLNSPEFKKASEATTDKKKGGMVKTKKYSKGGTASSRADGIAVKGKTRGKIC
jgi:hypothetical protein